MTVKTKQVDQSFKAILDPAWRFTKVRHVIGKDRSYFITDDKWINNLFVFLKHWEEIDDPEELEDSFQLLYWAYQIFRREGKGPRYQLEALLLTDLSFKEIEEILGLPKELIEAYEKCFFNVRDIQNKQALKSFILAQIKDRGLNDLDNEVVWKQIALTLGPEILIALWSDKEFSEEEFQILDRVLKSQVVRNALAASKVRRINQFNAGEIMEEYFSLKRLENDTKKLESETITTGSDAEFVNALLQSIKFVLAPMQSQVPEEAAIELTGAIKQLPGLIERINGVKQEEKDGTKP